MDLLDADFDNTDFEWRELREGREAEVDYHPTRNRLTARTEISVAHHRTNRGAAGETYTIPDTKMMRPQCTSKTVLVIGFS